jgi:hypothetical protein
MNYAADPIVIAAVLRPAPSRSDGGATTRGVVFQLTNQLNDVLFPVVVDCDSAQRNDRLRDLLVQGRGSRWQRRFRSPARWRSSPSRS